MALSSAVVAGTAATAAAVNLIRSDVVDVTTGHGHLGTGEDGKFIGYVPVGGIIMWYGSLAQFNALPEASHWKVCDGTNGTIDMSGLMPIGVNGTYTQGSTGGSSTHSHEAGTLGTAAHDHTPGTQKFYVDANGIGLGEVQSGTGTWALTSFVNVQTMNAGQSGQTSTKTGLDVSGDVASSSSLPPYKALYFLQRIS
jgi:hypothetical protein